MRSLGAFLVLAAVGCSADATSSGLDDLSQLDDDARELVQGCTWHEAPSGFMPWEPESCWRVYLGTATRLSLEPLRHVCDAPQLPHCVLLAGTDKPIGYFDRSQVDAPKIIRYERSPNCEPCE